MNSMSIVKNNINNWKNNPKYKLNVVRILLHLFLETTTQVVSSITKRKPTTVFLKERITALCCKKKTKKH